MATELEYVVKLTFQLNKLAAAEISSVGNTLEKVSQIYDAILAKTKEQNALTGEQNKQLLEQTANLFIQSKKLLELYKVHKLNNLETKSIAEQYVAMQDQIKALVSDAGRLKGVGEDTLKIIAKTTANAKMLGEELTKSAVSAKNIAAGLNNIGLGGIGRLVSGFTSVAGVLSMFVAALMDYLKLAEKVSMAQFRVYGSVNQTAAAVRGLSRDYGVTQETAVEITKALAEQHVVMSGGELRQYAGDMAMISEATGFSAESMATFTKRLQTTGSSSQGSMKAIQALAAASHDYGLTAAEASQVMGAVSSKAILLHQTFGDKAPQQYAQMMTFLAAKAKQYGIEISGLTDMMDYSEGSIDAFAVAIGGKAYFQTAEENMADYIATGYKQIEQITAGMPAGVKMQFMKTYAPMQEMREKLLEEGVISQQMSEQQIKEAIAKQQEEAAKSAKADKLAAEQRESSLKAMNAMMNSLAATGAAVAGILQPLLWIIGQIAQGIVKLNEMTGGIFGGVILGALVFFGLLKKLNFGPLAWVKEQISKIFTKKAVDPKEAKGFAESLHELAYGFGKALRVIAKWNLVGLAILIATMAVIGGAVVGITYLAKLAGVQGQLTDAGLAVLAMAAAMWVISKISGNINLGGILVFGLAAILLGAAMIPLAYAISLVGGDGSQLIIGALALLVIGGIMLAIGFAGNAMWPLLGGVLAFTIAAGLLALGLLAFAGAIAVAGSADNLLKGALAALALAGAIVAVALAGMLIIPALLGLFFLKKAAVKLGEALMAFSESIGGADTGQILAGTEAVKAIMDAIWNISGNAMAAILALAGVAGLMAIVAPILFVGMMALVGVLGIGLLLLLPKLVMLTWAISLIAGAFLEHGVFIMFGAKVLQKLANALKPLLDTKSSQMKQFANAYDEMMRSMAASSRRNGGDINAALSGLSMVGRGGMGGMGGGEVTRTAARPRISLIDTAISGLLSSLFGGGNEKSKEDIMKETRDVLKRIESKMPTSGSSEEVQQILAVIKEYLPEIADQDDGFRSTKPSNWQN